MEQRSKRRETSRPPEQSNRRETGGRMAALGGPLEDSTMELELHVGATGASDYAARHTLPGQEANGGGGGEVGPGEGFAHGPCSHVVGPRAWPGSRISTVNRPHGRFRTALLYRAAAPRTAAAAGDDGGQVLQALQARRPKPTGPLSVTCESPQQKCRPLQVPTRLNFAGGPSRLGGGPAE
jgi:hypothetical protein